MGIFIETPGVLTTVQDGGRYGYEQFGVSPSGPMDPESFQLANILVGNPRDLSALEATMLGPTCLLYTSAPPGRRTYGSCSHRCWPRESPGRPPPDCGRDERYFS